MLKERIKEVVDFTKSESPYRKANKGWINQDIFLDLSPSADTFKQTNEAAKVTLFWSPINTLLSSIFLIIILSSILVFTSLSISKGGFDFNLFHNFGINDIVKVNENKPVNIIKLQDLSTTDSKIQQNLEIKDLDKTNLLDDDLIKADQKIINQNIDKQESLKKESQSKKDIKNLGNKQPKSNFI
ncbi:hypothetical protein [Prochlorococcus marinus]|uniref:hypothetical protein n=1 Tax=Prochlorococcus marinus TaxID=1219 RepID=UPI0022B47AF2|nr:hypothetical protein [Prochlorococcus marinus]